MKSYNEINKKIIEKLLKKTEFENKKKNICHKICTLYYMLYVKILISFISCVKVKEKFIENEFKLNSI